MRGNFRKKSRAYLCVAWLLLSAAILMLLTGTGCGAILDFSDGETAAVGDPTGADSQGDTTPSTPSGSTGKKIAFTFDDGPHAPTEDTESGIYPYTTYVLDYIESLRRAGNEVRVTFFVVGERAALYPETLRRAQSLGCEIGSHTYAHDSFRGQDDSFLSDTLDRASVAIRSAGVPAPYLYRPVGGAVTVDQLHYTASLGYTAVAWSIDTEDWKDHPSTADKYSADPTRQAAYEAFVEQKVRLILDQATEGDIILLHDLYMSSVDIFKRASEELLQRGFELVTVSELLGLDANSTPATTMYLSRGRTVLHMD